LINNKRLKNRIILILKNAKIYSNGLVRKGALLINNGIIETIISDNSGEPINEIIKKNSDDKVIDCEEKLILPGIIDVHSHLRDMGQSEKETFETGTKAAAFSGITTVFNMPNTVPPAITSDQVKKWMEKAEDNLHINVGFIAGVPKDINNEEIFNIIDLGVIGFKIYPLKSLNEVDWMDPLNMQKLLFISHKFQIPIFIHPDWPIYENEKKLVIEDWIIEKHPFLYFHNNMYPVLMELAYVNFVIENYYKILADNDIEPEEYPIVHFCHISSRDSYSLIKMALQKKENLKITFEVTPHHLLLSWKIKLDNPAFGKVLPPLREEEHPSFLFKEFNEGNIKIIGTDHAPHTLEEKAQEPPHAPSGFPGFETYSLLLLDLVSKYQLSLENFVQAASENPAKTFNLNNKGFIKEGFDADLIIIDKVDEYALNPQLFKTKAKFSPFKDYKTTVKIWKVFLKGIEINRDDAEPTGVIIKRSS